MSQQHASQSPGRARGWGIDDIPDQTGRHRRHHRRQLRHRLRGRLVPGPPRRRASCSPGATPARPRRPRDRLLGQVPGASLDTVALDLASLESVRRAAIEIRARYPRLDLLINNAGVMMPPLRPDRRRLRAAVRHQSPRPLRADRARAAQPARRRRLPRRHRQQQRPQDGPDRLRPTSSPSAGTGRMAAYGQSKLANLLFTYELQRRLAQAPPPPSPSPPTPAPPTPPSSATCPSGCRSAPGSSPTRTPRAAPCPPCAPPPTPRPRRRLLRPVRVRRVQRPARPRPVQRPVPRRRRPAAAVGHLRAAHRGHVPGLSRRLQSAHETGSRAATRRARGI